MNLAVNKTTTASQTSRNGSTARKEASTTPYGKQNDEAERYVHARQTTNKAASMHQDKTYTQSTARKTASMAHAKHHA